MYGVGLRVEGLGIGVWRSGFRVRDLGFGVERWELLWKSVRWGEPVLERKKNILSEQSSGQISPDHGKLVKPSYFSGRHKAAGRVNLVLRGRHWRELRAPLLLELDGIGHYCVLHSCRKKKFYQQLQ